jgi:hypothetical protein
MKKSAPTIFGKKDVICNFSAVTRRKSFTSVDHPQPQSSKRILKTNLIWYYFLKCVHLKY